MLLHQGPTYNAPAITENHVSNDISNTGYTNYYESCRNVH